MKNPQQILDELKTNPPNDFYININEWKWMGDNKELLKDAITGHSLLNDEMAVEYPYALGGLIYAIREMSDSKRKELANSYTNKMIIDAEERLPHLEYIKKDRMTIELAKVNMMHLDSLIEVTKKTIERKKTKNITSNTFVDWKLYEFIEVLETHGIIRTRDKVDIIYYLFKKYNYEGYGNTNTQIGDNVTESSYKNTIKSRISNLYKKENQATVFRLWATD